MLDLGIDLDVWPWVWLGIAVVFALIELIALGGTIVLLPFAVSAFFAAILGFYDVAIEIQWAVFVFGGGLLFLALWKWASRFVKDNQLDPGVGANRLVGLTAIVTRDISPDDVGRNGRVSVDGEMWAALSADGGSYATGQPVRVTSVQGTRVVVEGLVAAGGDQQDAQPEGNS